MRGTVSPAKRDIEAVKPERHYCPLSDALLTPCRSMSPLSSFSSPFFSFFVLFLFSTAKLSSARLHRNVIVWSVGGSKLLEVSPALNTVVVVWSGIQQEHESKSRGRNCSMPYKKRNNNRKTASQFPISPAKKYHYHVTYLCNRLCRLGPSRLGIGKGLDRASAPFPMFPLMIHIQYPRLSQGQTFRTRTLGDPSSHVFHNLQHGCHATSPSSSVCVCGLHVWGWVKRVRTCVSSMICLSALQFGALVSCALYLPPLTAKCRLPRKDHTNPDVVR
jgi:hypothetical protein